MKYNKLIILKDGRECILRNGTEQDGQAALENFILTHRQTDYLLSYPDEITCTAEEEARHLKEKEESDHEVLILAEVDGAIVGMAGVDRVGAKAKVRHRASFGISVDEAFWNLGIGRAMTRACIKCAVSAGYAQLELEVAAENEIAINIYRSEGFTEYGRNPRGFRSRMTGWQELVLMRIEIDE